MKAKKAGRKAMKTRNAIDMELVLLCALMAVVATFGLITGVAALLDVRLQECDAAVVVGIGCTLSGLFWGILLIANCHKVSRKG